MSGYVPSQPLDYWAQNQQQQQPPQEESYNFEMPVQQDFQQELNFQSFEATPPAVASVNQTTYASNPYLNPSASYMGEMYMPSPSSNDKAYGSTGEDFDDEPPLLEELGINPEYIVQKELKTFLDNSKNGVIYFSFGSNARSSFLSDSQRDAFITVFSNLSQNVVWKIDSDDTAIKVDTTKNILLKTWVPQAALLGHKNVKLFITQGGLQSTEETITHQVPIIGIPFHSDQTANVDSCVKHGMGVLLEFDDITIDSLNASIYKILNNPSYKENAVRLSKLLYDKPLDGVEKAVWWIEYVIRHKGAKHLRSHAMDIPWYQYLFLDIIGFVIGIILILFTLLYTVLKVVFIVLRKLFQRKNNVSIEKKVK